MSKAPTIETWPLARLQPYAGNPRVISDEAVAVVAASLREFGWRQPIVATSGGEIVAGHTRLKAALSIGMTEAPVLLADDLSPDQIRAYRLADNKTGEFSKWDLAKLDIELDAIDLDMAAFGFELAGTDIDEAAAEETPPTPANPVSRPGDIWVLGNHRIICGDSTKANTVEAVLKGVKPHLMVTDPPYGVEYDANWRDDPVMVGRGKGAPSGRAVGKVENDDRDDWTEAWALFPGEVAYVWHAALHAGTVAGSLEDNGFVMRAQIIWAKSHLAIGRGHYHWQHEPCWYAVKGAGHWQGDRKQTTLWQIEKPQKSETGHSTQKPVECMKRPIVNNSSPGQAIYEPFSGSGTTIIAGEMTGRHVYAVELNPAYVDVAVLRWQTVTGKRATHEATGRTFDELLAERLGADAVPAISLKDAAA